MAGLGRYKVQAIEKRNYTKDLIADNAVALNALILMGNTSKGRLFHVTIGLG